MPTYFGVVLEVNGKEIALQPKTAMDDIGKHGIEAALPPGTEVNLGEIKDGLESFLKTFGTGLPSADGLPDVLKGAFDNLATLEVTINDLYVKIPPGKGETTYRLGVYVGWPKPKDLVGSLKLKGFSLKFDGTGEKKK